MLLMRLRVGVSAACRCGVSFRLTIGRRPLRHRDPADQGVVRREEHAVRPLQDRAQAAVGHGPVASKMLG